MPFPFAPDDQFNRALIERVAPTGWTNPVPRSRYDLVVLGAGTAGLRTAAAAAEEGAKVALVEKARLGGNRLNCGHIPAYALIRSGRAVSQKQNAALYGVHADELHVDFAQVMERMRQLRAGISVHDSVERFRSLGVDVFFGEGKFRSRDSIQVGGQLLRFHKAAICVGARNVLPRWALDLEGSGDPKPGVMTQETLFNLTDLPKRFCFFGSDPPVCEMAQTFARLGARVLILDPGVRLLPGEDVEAAAVILRTLQRDGVELRFGAEVQGADSIDGLVRMTSRSIGGDRPTEDFDALFVAHDRRPNTERLELDSADVEFNRHGVVVDDFLRTTNPRVFAAGEVCSRFQFPGASEDLARVFVQNALFLGRERASQLIVPRCRFTSPEVAQVGLTVEDAVARKIPLQTFSQPLHLVDRAILDGETEGFVKVHVAAGTDQIVGATIVSSCASELMTEIVLAMRHGIGLRGFAATCSSCPAQSDVLRRIGEQWIRTQPSSWVKQLFRWQFGKD